ncbi:MAG: hypothetical protein ACRDU5_08180 [Mycobacterium sp.]
MGTHTPTRYRAASAGLVVAVLTAGCGGDKPVLDSSNRGSESRTADTTVQNAFIVPRFTSGSCAIQVGDAALTFTATNNRPTEPERLLAIASDAARAIGIFPGATLQIPPKSSIAAGRPLEHVGGSAGPGQPIAVRVEGLDKSARPGTSVAVTFRFDKYGDVTIPVPIEACPARNREAANTLRPGE